MIRTISDLNTLINSIAIKQLNLTIYFSVFLILDNSLSPCVFEVCNADTSLFICTIYCVQNMLNLKFILIDNNTTQ